MQLNKKVYIGTDVEEIRKIGPMMMSYWKKDKNLYDRLIAAAKEIYDLELPCYLFTNNIIEQCLKTKITVGSIRAVIAKLDSFNNYLSKMGNFVLPHRYFKWMYVDSILFIVSIHVDIESADRTYGYSVWKMEMANLTDDYKINAFEEVVFQLFSFFLFAELDIKFVKSKKKYGTKKSGYHNNTPSDVTIINSNWNHTIIRTDGFEVKGHFRLQPCGPGGKDRKLKWINAFKKNGYIRKATKNN